MKVIVDADACPVKEIVKALCIKYNIDLLFIHSISHISEADENVERIIVDSEAQAADMAIINNSQKGDLVITADTGLAAIILGKGCYALNPWGQIYTNENIDNLLENRYLTQKLLASGGRVKGPKKRKNIDNQYFTGALEKFLQKIIQIDG
ncbi:YaiI/YqxD family protein [Alkaliphilus peptidifermentans]|uniref:UPF0178 protein SAMN03080606_00480 n=1 Tax=Alkaliphilus peptidifermentans DSM 18978 TaxID=1120976 RepID=A0A1G5BP09_9FIRM|nr:YaiI/YqxD family protein [Alkaliphilus peptidifermentans]SCX91922.1 hypothetical protein SAMN03080606_00480 [Alkaliphilus peptidifermentans DSM 18978]